MKPTTAVTVIVVVVATSVANLRNRSPEDVASMIPCAIHVLNAPVNNDEAITLPPS